MVEPARQLRCGGPYAICVAYDRNDINDQRCRSVRGGHTFCRLCRFCRSLSHSQRAPACLAAYALADKGIDSRTLQADLGHRCGRGGTSRYGRYRARTPTCIFGAGLRRIPLGRLRSAQPKAIIRESFCSDLHLPVNYMERFGGECLAAQPATRDRQGRKSFLGKW
jgi:hypothetical protein